MLPKAYNPAEAEPEIARRWQQARAFHAEPGAAGEPTFAIFIPPPNVTAALHLGHALNNTLQDILVRRARMRGFNTLWMPGTDHAGIATQTVVEKRLMQQGKRRSDFTRDAFIAFVQAWKDEYEATILEQLKAMGASCDFERTRFTMDPVCAAAVRAAFVRLFADGLIDKGKRLVNWDPVSSTALADDEVEMEDVDGFMWLLRYPLTDGSGHVTVATTRPETMLGDTAVAVNPRDPRAAALRGKRVKLPIVGREIPIVEDDYVVMPAEIAAQVGADASDPKAAFATGFLKVTPAHDPNDWDIGVRHALPAINIMAPDASISDRHGWDDVSADARPFVGLSREDARKAIVEWFKSKGLLEGVKPYRHAVGHSYRTHVPIEPYLSEQWYVLVTDDRMRGSALRAMAPDQREHAASGTHAPIDANAPRGGARAPASATTAAASADDRSGDGGLHFYPARYARMFESWHENIRDWCISRQLWWGHRIPVWSRVGSAVGPEARSTAASTGGTRANSTGAHAAPVPSSRGARSRDSRGSKATLIAVESDLASAGCVHRVRVRDDGELEELLCVPEAQQPLIAEIESQGFKQDDDVLDTWFSSALWPLSTLGWPDPARFDMKGMLETFNPSSVLCTAREIITLWVSRMVMFNRYFTGDDAGDAEDAAGAPQPGTGRIPFRHVYIHPVVQDGFGQKMSKSLGNGVDPRDIIGTHGADAMRFVLAQIATDTQDVRLSVDMIDPHSGEIFTPVAVDDGAGHRVAAPIQQSPKHPGKRMVSFYGAMSGKALASAEMPLAINTSSRFDVGRNFATKLWNAVRFALGSAGADGSADTETGAAAPQSADDLIRPISPIDPATRPLIDRWMLARLAHAVRTIDTALDNYRFSDSVDALYDIFWRDLCDWYLEGIKPSVRTDPAQQAVLLRVVDAVLRLAHPLCPFVTESLWSVVGTASAARAPVKGVALPPSTLLTTARWPQVAASLDDDAGLRSFERVQALVSAIRNLRGERQLPPKRRLGMLVPPSIAALVTEAGGVVEALAGIDRVEPRSAHDSDRPPTAVPLPFEGSEILLTGFVDATDTAGERQRLDRLIGELRKAVDGFERKLGNAGYVSKAPPEVVAQTRQMLESARGDLAAAERSLSSITS